MARVNFFVEEVDFDLPFPRKTSTWIIASAEKEKRLVKELNFIFCSDPYLSGINRDYLKHSSLTDIVTFDNSESDFEIEGDIFISIDRVKENARKFNVSFLDELHRVMIHGVLHLLGYQDKSKSQKERMRKTEDAYLSLRPGISPKS